jgi:hypothetical protein
MMRTKTRKKKVSRKTKKDSANFKASKGKINKENILRITNNQHTQVKNGSKSEAKKNISSRILNIFKTKEFVVELLILLFTLAMPLIIQNVTEKKEQIIAYNSIIESSENANEKVQKILELKVNAKKKSNSELVKKIHLYLADFYFELAETKDFRENLEKSISEYKYYIELESKDIEQKAFCNFRIGSAYLRLSNYEYSDSKKLIGMSLKYLIDAKKQSKNDDLDLININKLIAKAYINRGNENDYEEAIQLIDKVISDLDKSKFNYSEEIVKYANDIKFDALMIKGEALIKLLYQTRNEKWEKEFIDSQTKLASVKTNRPYDICGYNELQSDYFYYKFNISKNKSELTKAISFKMIVLKYSDMNSSIYYSALSDLVEYEQHMIITLKDESYRASYENHKSILDELSTKNSYSDNYTNQNNDYYRKIDFSTTEREILNIIDILEAELSGENIDDNTYRQAELSYQLMRAYLKANNISKNDIYDKSSIYYSMRMSINKEFMIDYFRSRPGLETVVKDLYGNTNKDFDSKDYNQMISEIITYGNKNLDKIPDLDTFLKDLDNDK